MSKINIEAMKKAIDEATYASELRRSAYSLLAALDKEQIYSANFEKEAGMYHAQAEAAAEREAEAKSRIAKAEAHAEEVNGWYVKIKTRMLAAEAELAALLGAAVPVAWGTMQQDWPDEDRSLFLDKDIAESYSQNCYPLTPLFTHPAPPVVDLQNVLQVPYRISGQNFKAYDADDLRAALESAGITVKSADGEG